MVKDITNRDTTFSEKCSAYDYYYGYQDIQNCNLLTLDGHEYEWKIWASNRITTSESPVRRFIVSLPVFSQEQLNLIPGKIGWKFQYGGASGTVYLDLSKNQNFSGDATQTKLNLLARNVASGDYVNEAYGGVPEGWWSEYKCDTLYYWRFRNHLGQVTPPFLPIPVDCSLRCNPGNLNMSIIPNAANPSGQMTFGLGQSSEGSLWLENVWQNSAGISGVASSCNPVFWPSQTCTATNLAGSYNWTHRWRVCIANSNISDISNCSFKCEKSASFTVGNPAVPTPTPAGCANNPSISLLSPENNAVLPNRLDWTILQASTAFNTCNNTRHREIWYRNATINENFKQLCYYDHDTDNANYHCNLGNLVSGNRYEWYVAASNESRRTTSAPNSFTQGTNPPQQTVDDTSAGLTFDGWTRVGNTNYSGGTFMLSSVKDQKIIFNSPATNQITLFTLKNRYQGMADIYLDGVRYETLDLYAATGVKYSKTYNFATSSIHTLEVRVLGAKNQAAIGTQVRIDKFEANGQTFEDTSPQVQYNSWKVFVTANAQGGSYRYSGTKGATITYNYPGTGRTVYLVTGVGPIYGRANLYLQGTLSFYDAVNKLKVPVSLGMVKLNETKEIKFEVLGEKDAASTGYRFVFDGFGN